LRCKGSVFGPSCFDADVGRRLSQTHPAGNTQTWRRRLPEHPYQGNTPPDFIVAKPIFSGQIVGYSAVRDRYVGGGGGG
jgi:hypothetical protein